MTETKSLLNRLAHGSDRRGHRRTPTDSGWEEVDGINSHAVFMGYLSQAVRGLGILVLTWSTVVLLGGFVSMLKKKDFWCLTVITFMQTAGVFDGSRNERLSNIVISYRGFVSTAATVLVLPLDLANGLINVNEGSKGWYCVYTAAAYVVMSIQLLALAVMLCPIIVLYISGPYVPIWLAVWRLKNRSDYGNMEGDVSSTNLRVALDVLYSLTLVQGSLVYYMAICALAGKSHGTHVVTKYKVCKGEVASIWGYLRETMGRCENDPSFTRGRNLITYAVELIKSESADRVLSGVRILDTITRMHISRRDRRKWRYQIIGQHMLIKQLIGSPSSADVIQKLLQMLDSRSPYDKEMRRRAARIVAYLAGSIRLEQFPGGIECIVSLLDTFEEHRLLEPYQRDWLLDMYEQDWYQEVSCMPASLIFEQEFDGSKPLDAYKELVLQGLNILRRLTAIEDNCIIMSNTRDLLTKIMAPVSSDLLHRMDHGSWTSSIIEGSLRVMSQLLMAPSETCMKLRYEVLSNKDVIRSVESILKCGSCGTELQKQAIRILTQLYTNGLSSTGDGSRELFTKTLICIFTDDNKDVSVRKLAGESLSTISLKSKVSAVVILQADGGIVVSNLIKIVRNVENHMYRISAAEILEHLCIHRTTEDDYLKKLKNPLIDVVPKLLEEIPHCSPTEQVQRTTEAGMHGFCSQYTDVEEGKSVGISENNEDNKSSSKRKKDKNHNVMKLQMALLSLCITVCDTFTLELDGTGPGDCAFGFTWKLKEMVQRNTQLTADSLKMLQLTSKMAVSMLKRSGCEINRDLEGLIDSLSKASETMLDLESSTVFAKGKNAEKNTTEPEQTLRSLVEEARELLQERKA